MSSLALITLEISDFFPQNFPFDNFCFIFTSDSHDFESEIYYLSKNQITHKTPLLKKDIRYSIKILRNDSLIGISDFIIPSMLFMRKENFFEKICMINMTDSTKRLLFGNLSPSNNLRINIRAKITYMQGQANKNNKKIFSPKSNSGINSKKNIGEGSPKINNGNNVYNANANNINNQNNNINNSNFVFNKQQILMSKKVPLMKSSQNNNNTNNNINIGNRYNKNNNMNMADIILQQQQQNINPNNNQKNILPKNNFFQKNSNREKGQSPAPGQQKIEEDPADTSVIYPEISNPIQPIDEEFTEFMQKFIEKNPLEQLNQFNDINEMMIYTKNVIDKLLCYQQEYYERLKTSVSINNRLNEILVKYNEKYRNIVKKIHRLNEETNSNDMKKDAVINVHRTENSNLKQIIPLKMKELKLYQEMYGEGIKDILLAKKENEKENNDINANIDKSNELNEKKKNVLMKLLKNCVNNYGPFDTLFNKESLEKINSNEKQKNILEKIKQEIDDNNKNNNEKNKLEFVISENPDDLDIKLNQYLTSIYSENRLPKINFKKLNENLYQYGSQQVSVIEEDNVIKIKHDEGTLLLDNFIEINAQAEEEKMMQVNQE
jgi:hypothetical protein